MPRRREVTRRNIILDPKFKDYLITKFINIIMLSGKKSVAESIVYGAFSILLKNGVEDPILVFKKAIDNIKPIIEVRSRRVGGANYQVPVEIRNERRIALAFRWLRNSASVRIEKTMKEKLAFEVLEAPRGRGNAVKKREETHKMAEANKAFSHYKK